MTIALICAAAALAALGAGFSLRYAWWRRTADYARPRILMYHMVRPSLRGGKFNKLRVSPREFERQIKWLVDRGWRFAKLSELPALADQRKTVALTFDDGYRDNFLAAHPLLRKYDAKATLFLVVDRLDRDWSAAKNARRDGGELGAEPKLSDEEVRAMLESGVWELGAHSLTHPPLPGLEAADREREIAAARVRLETDFNVRVQTFAYPFGLYGDADRRAVAAAGYRLAVTTEPGVDAWPPPDPLAIKRVKISGKEGRLGFALRLRTGRRGAWG